MTSRTQTRSPTDVSMWRRLVGRAHPDAGGDHELFIWTSRLRTVVCGGEFETIKRKPAKGGTPRPSEASAPRERVPFDPGEAEDHNELTRRAIALGREAGEPYASLLELLADCYSDLEFYEQECVGATYKQLAALAHRSGMTRKQRVKWYRIAESVPLSQRHAGHVFARMTKEDRGDEFWTYLHPRQ